MVPCDYKTNCKMLYRAGFLCLCVSVSRSADVFICCANRSLGRYYWAHLWNSKSTEVLILPKPSDTRLWSDCSASVLLPAGQFRSGLQLTHFHPHSLGNPSICILSLTSFLLPFTYRLWVLSPWCPLERPSPSIGNKISCSFNLHPQTITHTTREWVFPIPLLEKKT